MMEAEEIHALASFSQVHDPRLRRLELKAHLGEDRGERLKGALGFPSGRAYRQQIVCVAQKYPVSALGPLPVEPVQIDVAQDGRDHTALRGAAVAVPDRRVFHHPGAQHRAQELEDVTVRDPLLDRRHQPGMRDRLKTVGDVRFRDPSRALPGLVNDDLERVVRRAPGPEPERALEHVGLEDRLNDDLRSRLHNAVADSRDREWSLLGRPAGLRNEHPAGRERTPPPVPQIRGQLVKELGDAVLLDVSDGLSVDAGRAAIGAHQLPRPLQNVPAVDLVMERVEPSFGVGFGRPVKRSL